MDVGKLRVHLRHDVRYHKHYLETLHILLLPTSWICWRVIPTYLHRTSTRVEISLQETASCAAACPEFTCIFCLWPLYLLFTIHPLWNRVVVIVLILLLSCCDNLRRRVPLNFIALGLFVSRKYQPGLKSHCNHGGFISQFFQTCVYFSFFSLSLSDGCRGPDARFCDNVSVSKHKSPTDANSFPQ